MNPHLVGEGLHLRAPRAPDAPAMVDAVTESQPELGRWLVWAAPGYGRADADAWCEQRHADGHLVAFHVFDATDGRLLGGVGFHGFDANNGKAEIGYWVRSSARGAGVAVRAARVALSDRFAHTPTERVELIIAVGNTASQRVAEKLGASREGLVRRRLLLAHGPADAYLYGLLRSELRPCPVERVEEAAGERRAGSPTELRSRRRWSTVLR